MSSGRDDRANLADLGPRDPHPSSQKRSGCGRFSHLTLALASKGLSEAALKSYIGAAVSEAWRSVPLSAHSAKLADLCINLRSGCVADMRNPAARGMRRSGDGAAREMNEACRAQA